MQIMIPILIKVMTLVMKGILKLAMFLQFPVLVITYLPVTLLASALNGGSEPHFIKTLGPFWWLAIIIFSFILRFKQSAQGIPWMENPYKQFSKDIFNSQKGKFLEKGFSSEEKLVNSSNLQGIVYGKKGNNYMIQSEDEDGHPIIIGGPGSGKTTSIAIPTLQKWKKRAFVIDIKGELLQKGNRNPDFVKAFNPESENTYHYDPYYMLHHSDNLLADVKELAISIIPDDPKAKDTFWFSSAQNYLSAIICHCYKKGFDFSKTIEYAQLTQAQIFFDTLKSENDTDSLLFVSQYVNLKDDTLGSILAEMSRYIQIFITDKNLAKVLSSSSKTINPSDIESYDIFIQIPEHKIESWKALLTMITNQMIKYCERRSCDLSKPESILMLLDEFPRLGKITSIQNALATLRGRGVKIMIIIQSKAQLKAIYGNEFADAIVDSTSYKAILKATEPSTQEWCSKMVGTAEKLKHSKSTNSDIFGFAKGMGANSTSEEKALIKPEAFAYLKDELILITPTGFTRLKKCYYFSDKNFVS